MVTNKFSRKISSAFFALVLFIQAGYITSAEDKTQLQKVKFSVLELRILSQLLQEVDLSTDEMDSFLAIESSLDAIVEQHKTTEGAKVIKFEMNSRAYQDLLFFLQRISIKGSGAKQINEIINKIQKVIPKDSPLRENKPKQIKSITFDITAQEGSLLQQLLLRIEVYVPEVNAFIEIMQQLEKAMQGIEDPNKVISVKFSEQDPINLLVFMQRFNLIGAHVKTIYSLTNRLLQFQKTKTTVT